MLSSKMKSLAFGVPATCLMIYAPAIHAQEAIHIGVAANFANTINDIISAFNNANGYLSNNFTVNSDSTANLETCILTPSTATNYTTNCPFGHYDLFLAANTAAPAAVSTLGMIYSSTTQAPFFYAQGSLVLAAVSTNITGGLPTTGSSLYTNFVIANPAKAPYGLAAMQVLNGLGYSLSTTSTYPVGDVYTSANIGTTFSSVNASPPTYAYGFVAKSQLCDNGNLGAVHGPFYIRYAYEYLYSGASVTSPGFSHTNTTPTYGEIIQDGIAIELGQTSATKAEVLALVNYLTTSVSSPAYPNNDGQGIANIQTYCYGLTP